MSHFNPTKARERGCATLVVYVVVALVLICVCGNLYGRFA